MLRSTIVYRPTNPDAGGWVEVNPAFAKSLAALGITSAAGFLDLPGEVVSGHPDRHVVRIELPGFASACYLKRQHTITRRERLRNLLAGFGWSARCTREATVLKQLAVGDFPCPRWIAFGEDGGGRAFLLVEEVAGASDLRSLLADSGLSPGHRRELADRLGRLIARIHAAGITTPDLSAKHLLVSAEAHTVTIIDWQSARRVRIVSPADRLRALAMLHASLAEHLASPRQRLRVLRSALASAREAGIVEGRFSELVRRVVAEAARVRHRRSIRDQRHATTSPPRLVWVAGESVCAIPDVAAIWPPDALAAPFYGCEPGELGVRLADGRDAHLIRGRSVAPITRMVARLRGRSWRSPGVTLGRVLFHLQRYGIRAPRLLAFGQRLTGVASAEWFALHTLPADALPATIDSAGAEELGRLLRQLHEAGCRIVGPPLPALGSDAGSVCVRDVTRIALPKRCLPEHRAADLSRLLAALPPEAREAAEVGYCSDSPTPASRLIHTEVNA